MKFHLESLLTNPALLNLQRKFQQESNCFTVNFVNFPFHAKFLAIVQLNYVSDNEYSFHISNNFEATLHIGIIFRDIYFEIYTKMIKNLVKTPETVEFFGRIDPPTYDSPFRPKNLLVEFFLFGKYIGFYKAI